MNDALSIRIEWLDAPDVSAPELAATWARYEVWVGGQCVTQVETDDGTIRRSVYGSVYPLAEWIATNWWLLTAHVRPSAIDARYWTWANVDGYEWLAWHNLRGSGDGMAWPDLTLVPEGGMTRVRWTSDRAKVYRRLRFISAGDSWARSADIRDALATFVENVLDRLAEQDLLKTSLRDDWDAIGSADVDESEFCDAAARLGLDPYAVDQRLAEQIVELSSSLPEDLAGDFFDSADAGSLATAASWLAKSVGLAGRAAQKARHELGELWDVVGSVTGGTSDVERPWVTGYAMARAVRQALEVPVTQHLDLAPWVGRSTVSAPSAGIQGAVAVDSARCGMVLGGEPLSPVFGAARALGRALLRPAERRFILSAAHRDDERVARAFAAELLAPAAGIREMLSALGKQDDSALDAVARRYGVSPLVIRHQFDNQLAMHAAS